jgi:hypothetical protein
VSHVAIDHPDEVIHWFACYPEAERARRIAGDCPHDCRHMGTAVVGWGPDREHHELLTCTDSGCQGNCRGWLPAPGTYQQIVSIDWKALA